MRSVFALMGRPLQGAIKEIQLSVHIPESYSVIIKGTDIPFWKSRSHILHMLENDESVLKMKNSPDANTFSSKHQNFWLGINTCLLNGKVRQSPHLLEQWKTPSLIPFNHTELNVNVSNFSDKSYLSGTKLTQRLDVMELSHVSVHEVFQGSMAVRYTYIWAGPEHWERQKGEIHVEKVKTWKGRMRSAGWLNVLSHLLVQSSPFRN